MSNLYLLLSEGCPANTPLERWRAALLGNKDELSDSVEEVLGEQEGIYFSRQHPICYGFPAVFSFSYIPSFFPQQNPLGYPREVL